MLLIKHDYYLSKKKKAIGKLIVNHGKLSPSHFTRQIPTRGILISNKGIDDAKFG